MFDYGNWVDTAGAPRIRGEYGRLWSRTPHRGRAHVLSFVYLNVTQSYEMEFGSGYAVCCVFPAATRIRRPFHITRRAVKPNIGRKNSRTGIVVRSETRRDEQVPALLYWICVVPKISA